jgi:hypothetical protein
VGFSIKLKLFWIVLQVVLAKEQLQTHMTQLTQVMWVTVKHLISNVPAHVRVMRGWLVDLLKIRK